MNKPEWIFFDVGSTLVDESAAYENRSNDITQSYPSAPPRNDNRVFWAYSNNHRHAARASSSNLRRTAFLHHRSIHRSNRPASDHASLNNSAFGRKADCKIGESGIIWHGTQEAAVNCYLIELMHKNNGRICIFD